MRFLTAFSRPNIVLNVYKISLNRNTSVLYFRGTNLDSSVSIDWVNTKPPPVVSERLGFVWQINTSPYLAQDTFSKMRSDNVKRP